MNVVEGVHSDTLEWYQGGNPEEIEDLINDGANLNFYNKLGNNAFQEACARGQIQCKS